MDFCPILRPKYVLDDRIYEKEFSHVQILGDVFFFRTKFYLERIKQLKRNGVEISIHLLGLNLGARKSEDQYLLQVDRLVHELEPVAVSDHICKTTDGDRYHHDLKPVPFNEITADHFAKRALELEKRWGTKVLLENPSLYVEAPRDSFFELKFLEMLIERGVNLLFDMNNFVLNQKNLFSSDSEFVLSMLKAFIMKNSRNIGEYHLIGPGDYEVDGFSIDTHSSELTDLHLRAADFLEEINIESPVFYEWEGAPNFEAYWSQFEKWSKQSEISNACC